MCWVQRAQAADWVQGLGHVFPLSYGFFIRQSGFDDLVRPLLTVPLPYLIRPAVLRHG